MIELNANIVEENLIKQQQKDTYRFVRKKA